MDSLIVLITINILKRLIVGVLVSILILNTGCRTHINDKKYNINSSVDFEGILSDIKIGREIDSAYLEYIIDSFYSRNYNNADSYSFALKKYRLYNDHYINPSNALHYTDIMVRQALAENEPDKIILAYTSKANALHKLKDYKNSFIYYHKAKLLAIKEGDSSTIATQNYVIAMSLYKQKRYKEAIQHFETANALGFRYYKKFENGYRLQEIFNNIGISYLKLNKSDSALLHFDLALKQISDLKRKFPPNEDYNGYLLAYAVSYTNKSIALYNLGVVGEALSSIEKAISFINECNCDNDQRIQSLLIKSRILNTIGQYKKADDLLMVVKNNLDTTNLNLYAQYLEIIISKYNKTTGISSQLELERILSRIQNKQNEIVVEETKGDIKNGIELIELEHKINRLNQNMIQVNYNNKLKVLLIISVSAIALIVIVFSILLFKKYKKNEQLLNKLSTKNAQLDSLNKHLEANDEEKNKFIKSIAHDILNPLTIIVNHTELLMLNENIHDDINRSVNVIRKTSSKIISIAKELLSELKTLQKPVNKTNTNLIQSITEAINEVKQLAEAKNINIMLLTSIREMSVYIDKIQIERVLTNILINAIKFSYSDNSIFVNVYNKKDNVAISIQDFGIGIPEELSKEIFKPMGKAGRLGTKNEKSNGLGLSISKSIIEKHGGDIWFESKENTGTTFYIELPMYPAPDDELQLHTT